MRSKHCHWLHSSWPLQECYDRVVRKATIDFESQVEAWKGFTVIRGDKRVAFAKIMVAAIVIEGEAWHVATFHKEVGPFGSWKEPAASFKMEEVASEEASFN